MSAAPAIEPSAAPTGSVTGAPPRPLRVMLLISSLEPGGAERQVVELMRNFDRQRISPQVCALSAHVPLAQGLPDRAELHVVPKRGKYDVTTVPRVAALLRQQQIDLVHAFLFDAEMVARLAARRGGARVVISSERNADYRRPLAHRIGLWLTRRASHALIANSTAGRRFSMRTLGLAEHAVHVIHNGCDTQRFVPVDGAALRSALGPGPGTPLIGMAAAFKRQKRHADFFAVARRLLESWPTARFVCAGEPLRDNHQGAGDYHQQMRRCVAELGLAPRVTFLGRSDDMPQFYSACDVTMLTSEHEGTPNVLLESMACQTPVVATRIADNELIVRDGETGLLAPVGDIAALTRHVDGLLRDTARRAAMGEEGRRWVTQAFSSLALARRTEQVYADVWRAQTGEVRP